MPAWPYSQLTRLARSETCLRVSLNSSFVMIECQPGVKNASSGRMQGVVRSTRPCPVGETINVRSLLRSAISMYPGSGPGRTVGSPSAT